MGIISGRRSICDMNCKVNSSFFFKEVWICIRNLYKEMNHDCMSAYHYNNTMNCKMNSSEYSYSRFHFLSETNSITEGRTGVWIVSFKPTFRGESAYRIWSDTVRNFRAKNISRLYRDLLFFALSLFCWRVYLVLFRSKMLFHTRFLKAPFLRFALRFGFSEGFRILFLVKRRAHTFFFHFFRRNTAFPWRLTQNEACKAGLQLICSDLHFVPAARLDIK